MSHEKLCGRSDLALRFAQALSSCHCLPQAAEQSHNRDKGFACSATEDFQQSVGIGSEDWGEDEPQLEPILNRNILAVASRRAFCRQR